MNWYRNNAAEWKEIIETVARELGRTELMVEKDTIQSMFLLELSKSELPLVLKGGTSLSKAYNLIDRFLVNLKYIKCVTGYKVVLSNGQELTVPRARYKTVKDTFIAYKGEL